MSQKHAIVGSKNALILFTVYATMGLHQISRKDKEFYAEALRRLTKFIPHADTLTYEEQEAIVAELRDIVSLAVEAFTQE